jgi:hypothetical protein
MAQCNGVFPNNTACGNVTGASNTPRAIPLSSFPAAIPGGSSGQVQYNNAGAFGGLTNAQLTALCQQFSSSLLGCVPASGGGTTNFLRADGSWAPPPINGVTSFNARTGAVVPVLGDYTVSNGGTGISSCLGEIGGLQPLKLSGSVIGVNPGTWCNNIGTQLFTTSSVLTVNLATSASNCSISPALGGQVSGALSPTSSTTDGTEVFLYLFHCISNGAPILIGSSSDNQLALTNFSATATAPGVIDFHTVHGLRKRQSIYFSSTGTLPAPLGATTQYFVCTVPSNSTITVATSIANANSGTCLTFTTTGTGTLTGKWGAQADADFSAGAGVLQFDRGFPYFAFVWSWSLWGNSGTPGGSNGIPDFQTAQGASDTILTGAGIASPFQVLTSGTSSSFTSLDLSSILANINRRVLLFPVCAFATTAGQCFIASPGAGSTGFPVGDPSVATLGAGSMSAIQTDSTTAIQWRTTGGATLSLYVAGWTAVDPR